MRLRLELFNESREAVAEKIRISGKTLGNAENGKRISVMYAQAIAREYGKRVEELFDIRDPRSSQQRHVADQETSGTASKVAEIQFYIPHERNPRFLGRDVQLEALHRESKERNERLVVQVLAGLKGLGRTSIAVEYAYRFRKEYGLVWWIDGSSSRSLEKGYRALIENLQSMRGESMLTPVDQVSIVLGDFANWLLVIDNVISADSVLGSLPRTATGQVLIASADRNWKNVATIVDVPPFEPVTAIEFLECRLAKMPRFFDKGQLPELASELGCIPAALDIASSDLEQAPCPIENYIQRIRELRISSITEHLVRYGDSPEILISDEWYLTVRRAMCETPSVFLLLGYVAWLDDCEIPMDLVETSESDAIWESVLSRLAMLVLARHHRKYLQPPFPQRPSLRSSTYAHAFTKALATLQRYSIAKCTEHAFVIPEQIKLVIRSRRTRRQQRWLVRRTLELTVDKVLRRWSSSNWHTWIRHLKRAIEYAEIVAVPENTVEFVRARRILAIIEKKPGAESTPSVPEKRIRLSARDWLVVLKETARDILPRYWAIFGLAISWIVSVLSLCALASLFLFLRVRGAIPRYAELWQKVSITALVMSLFATIIFAAAHRIKGKTPTETEKSLES